MTLLETERLIIRNFVSADWEALHHMIAQYEASEYAPYDSQWPTSEDEIKKITEWFAFGDSYWAVCLKAANQFVGFVSLNAEKPDSHVLNLGYIFDFDYHGNGYASEACRAAIGHVFDQRQAQTVVAGTAAVNIPSCRLLERLGFKKKSESMGSFSTDKDGKPLEFLGHSYALSRDEWEAVNKE